MKYEIVALPARRVVGLSVRTGNSAPDCGEKIGGLWQELMCESTCERLGYRQGMPCYGLYTNYKWDDESYDVIAGCEAEHCPEGFVEVEIPAGEYAKFSFHGDVRQSVADAWSEIWSMQMPRAYTVDFEEYVSCGDDMQGEINIYVALAEVCQSCGMPMVKPADRGTEADGAPSHTYCTYCYQKGAFTWECSMEEMIEHNLKVAPEVYTDPEQARAQMHEYFPTLARWKSKNLYS